MSGYLLLISAFASSLLVFFGGSCEVWFFGYGVCGAVDVKKLVVL